MPIPVKVYSKKELRELYGISRETFNKWLLPIKASLPHCRPTAKILTPAQVRVIFDLLGEPEPENNQHKASARNQ
ncbi:MAG: hypothetical protein AAFZ15_13775 [Bacteroidota bacterium]